MTRRRDQLLGLTAALVRGGQRREAAVAQILRPDNLFQPFTTTSAGRYPEEFAVVREALADDARAEPRILSFGCASGEELFSLRADFPGARIHGIDINPLAVRTAGRRVRESGDERITVERAADAAALPQASYDVVLALAVFRHGALKAQPASCADLIRFADFERTVTGLCATLRPGGLFLIRHANFRFTDCAVAADFATVRDGFPSSNEGGVTPVYDRANRLVRGAAGDDGVYRKIA